MRTIFVLFDSLVRNALACYGGGDVETPNFKRFAQRSITFDNHYTGSVAAHINPPLSDREDAVPVAMRVALTAGGGTLHWVVDCLTG